MTYAAGGVRGHERFDIARVLSRMGGVLSRDFPVLAGLALILSGLPSLLIGLGKLDSLPLNGSTIGPIGLAFVWPFSAIISVLLQAAVIHGTIGDLNGRRADFRDCLTTALRHVLPLLGIGICVTVVCVVGLVFFIVPGLILGLMLCVAAPVRVVEGLGVFASMARSGDLTRYHRGAILLLFILYVVVVAMAQGVIEAIMLLLPAVVRALAQAVVQAAGALIGAAGVASIYFELRVIKEGIGAEALAAVFD